MKRSSSFLIFIFLGVFLLSCPLWAGSYPFSLKWKTIETKHFAIHFYQGEEEVAQKIAGISEYVYSVLSERFDAHPWGKTEVVLTDNFDQANGFTTVVPYNFIVLRVVPPAADHILANYDDWLTELFMHEYTHVIHISDTGYPAKALKYLLGKIMAPNGLTPGWVTEGIATYFETVETKGGRGRSSYTDMLLRTDILHHQFLHLDEMAGTQFSWPGWMAQYLYGVGFWNYLSETYGEKSIVDFSHQYGSSLLFFALNHQAKKVFQIGNKKKTFYALWADWKSTLETRYQKMLEGLEKEGLREGTLFLKPKKGESFTLPTLSPDGKKLAYVATSVDYASELRLRTIETGKEKVLLKKMSVQQISFSPDGERVLVSYASPYKRYYQYNDIFEITIKSGKAGQLTKGKRAREPDYSPDGKKIVAVIQETGASSLSVYDVSTKEWKSILKTDQVDHPRWLPAGNTVVATLHEKGQRDLWIIHTDTGERKRLTNNAALEDRPSVDSQNREIYYTSDVSGISNIYRYDWINGKTEKVTNVVSGAFVPAVSPDGTLFFQYYNGRGFEIHQSKFEGGEVSADVTRMSPPPPAGLQLQESNDGEGVKLPVKDYNPFKRLFIPRYIFPNIALIDNSVFASAAVQNSDPLNRHFWFGDVTFRSDNKFIGFDTGYVYARPRTPLSVGFSDFTVNYGDVFGLGTDFFEERRRASAGIGIPLMPKHRLGFNYFFENRSISSGIPAGVTLSSEGHYAGIFAQYSYGKIEGTPAQISPEKGEKITLNCEWTDRRLGASPTLGQRVLWGDARTYLRIPFTDHHVLALRAAGGAAFGDQFLQGNFGLGGSLGESPLTGTSTRVFTLRGLPLVTFSRDRAWVASAEYRVPLFRLERGIGTFPLALNSAHMAFFADIGDAYNRGNASLRPLLGVGGELRGDFVAGYHLPIMGRLGYGLIVTNRDRIAGVKDGLTGADARNGVVILEVGTSF